ncbi:hypothetical protein BDQ17DRAFT_1421606 [Cyathus striatus]|nr:hypothetical protein BDQ17DRAFT_1421606 [Cyathus striatus]
MTTTPTRPIPLRVSIKRAYVWDVDDIAIIRSQHRLCGILTGTLPHLSQQNVFLGIPLVLMPEEVVLLVETGAAVIIDDPTAHVQPTATQLQNWNINQQDSFKKQVELAEIRSVKEGSSSSRAFSEAALKKRKERDERKKAEALRASTAADESGMSAFASTSAKSGSRPHDENPVPTTFAHTLVSSGPSSSTLYTVVIPAASTAYEWYDTYKSSYNTIGAAKAAGIWEYPSNLQERARCGVFRGLWEKGYFMGGGIKFGGEYLVYPGDPLRYHSHFVASVLESPTASLKPMEIVAHGRLGTATKKAHLLCSWDDEKKEVSYLSIEWAGFG